MKKMKSILDHAKANPQFEQELKMRAQQAFEGGLRSPQWDVLAGYFAESQEELIKLGGGGGQAPAAALGTTTITTVTTFTSLACLTTTTTTTTTDAVAMAHAVQDNAPVA